MVRKNNVQQNAKNTTLQASHHFMSIISSAKVKAEAEIGDQCQLFVYLFVCQQNYSKILKVWA